MNDIEAILDLLHRQGYERCQTCGKFLRGSACINIAGGYYCDEHAVDAARAAMENPDMRSGVLFQLAQAYVRGRTLNLGDLRVVVLPIARNLTR